MDGLYVDGNLEEFAVAAAAVVVAGLSGSSEGTLWSGWSAPGRRRPAWLTSAHHVDERSERTCTERKRKRERSFKFRNWMSGSLLLLAILV